MEFKDAVKSLRVELGLTQSELAEALHITSLTVGRWERGLNQPNRAAVSLLLGFARVKGASAGCMDKLRKASASISKKRMASAAESTDSAEVFAFRQLIENAFFPVYISDIETDALLYLNHEAKLLFGFSCANVGGSVCYEELMHRDCPCAHCHKQALDWNHFIQPDIFTADDGTTYSIHAKLLEWRGRPAQVRYIMQTGGPAEQF